MSAYRKDLDVAGMSLENLLDNLFYAGRRAGAADLTAFHSHDVETSRAAIGDLEHQQKQKKAIVAEVLKRFEAKGGAE